LGKIFGGRFPFMQPHDPRQDALLHWLQNELGHKVDTLAPASSDASFRRYFRVLIGTETRIVMDAPPPQENIRPFLSVADNLKRRGVSTPEIFAADPEQGFVLLEDFGHTAYLDILTEQTADQLYGVALETLHRLQSSPEPLPNLPHYDEAMLRRELLIFREWCLEGYLELTLSPEEEALLTETFDLLVHSALSQPTVVVHRDYHSRNLMWTPDERLGVIDFQDAVIGPITYDLASLLRDCYVAWPLQKIERWIESFREQLETRGQLPATPQAKFRRWFDLMGAQRHLKAAGIFCRLKLRDNKPGYIGDIPRTLGYLLDATREQPDLAPFASFIIRRVLPRFLTTGAP
jgi:aminoglycoside/choline kinase family phosphotransferase